MYLSKIYSPYREHLPPTQYTHIYTYVHIAACVYIMCEDGSDK